MTRYSREMRWLHWGVALLVIVQYQLALTFDELLLADPRGRLASIGSWHVSIGLVILAGLAARIWFRLTQGVPPITGATRVPAHVAHAAIYVVLTIVIIAGFVRMDASDLPLRLFGLVEVSFVAPEDALRQVARRWHNDAANALVLLLSVHVVAAMLHGPILKDQVLYKMLPGPKD
ncbi:MAG: cytochrome b/b6 domain-containing protein [Pseudomonadota bacterium]